ncbi:uncharacterized protein LOC128724214 [Anopheles nili]|uniref:uncharacterized protein LOC128724214 n=1 Tax=Anopheles nili TaxID=185578 RepID=UPI00237B3FA3|nr:uncharacterized protein LOC128724214 [Anopheles nili]
MVGMNPEDQRRHLLFWGESMDPRIEPAIYAVTVMTFGATSSPGSAHFVKNTNAERFAEQFPRAVECIKHVNYVDDMLASVQIKEEAIRLVEEVRFIHQQGGFETRNWLSSSRQVLESLKEKSREDSRMLTDLSTEKVLGMWWDTTVDDFTYRLNTELDEALLSAERWPTKREILRTLR